MVIIFTHMFGPTPWVGDSCDILIGRFLTIQHPENGD